MRSLLTPTSSFAPSHTLLDMGVGALRYKSSQTFLLNGRTESEQLIR